MQTSVCYKCTSSSAIVLVTIADHSSVGNGRLIKTLIILECNRDVIWKALEVLNCYSALIKLAGVMLKMNRMQRRAMVSVLGNATDTECKTVWMYLHGMW